MHVRPGEPADTEAVAELHREAILTNGPAAYDSAQVAAWAEGTEPRGYVEPMMDAAVTFLVAEEYERVLGFGSLHHEPPSWDETADGEVTGLYVHPNAQRQGAGTLLLDSLESEARALGIERCAVTASLNAISFYEEAGYERVGRHEHSFSGENSETATVVEMVRRL